MNKTKIPGPPIGVCSTVGLEAEAGISFVKFCENYVTERGGKIVRDGGLAHGELNGFIYPARTAEDIFWNETLYSPSGLATLCGLKRKATNA